MQRGIILISLLFFSYILPAQEADTIKRSIKRQWTLSADFTEEVDEPVDTLFSLFHRHRIADKYSVFNAWPGNYGQPLYQISFFDRPADPDQFLYQHFLPFMHLPGNVHFMNTQVPYTELVWNFAGPRDRSDQTFRIRHSQNVNRKLNFGFIYDIIYNLGQYNYQRVNDKNFNFNTSYRGDKYRLYASMGHNSLIHNENGGISDPTQMESLDTRDIQVNLGGLNEANSTLKNFNILLVQRYTLNKPPVADTSATDVKKKKFRMNGTFSHILTYDATRRSYSDKYPLSGFYDTVYINRDVTFDTLYFRNLQNTLRFDFTTDESRKFRLGGGFGIRNELNRYYQDIRPYNFPAADMTTQYRSSNAVIGRLYNNIGSRFKWVATGELYLSGYRAGDFDLNGIISQSFRGKREDFRMDITGRVSNIQPSFFYNHWESNNFRWNAEPNKEFRIDAGTDIVVPGRNARLKFNYALIDNYTDFGSDALPSQHTGGLSVISLFLKKDFMLWKFNLANDLLLQQSSNEDVLDLPLLALRSAFFIQHNFMFSITGGNMNTQLGAEIVYNTNYNGYSFMPATGVYYRQNEVMTGNYPYLNAFFNVKIKRTRIFIKFDHVNSGFTGYNYFMVPYNPMNIRMFRYGFAWTFYD